MSKILHPDFAHRFDTRTGRSRTLTPEECEIEQTVITALSSTRNMIQYLVDPYADRREIRVVGAAIDPDQDVSSVVHSALEAHGFGDWAVQMTIKAEKDYFPGSDR